eukprot:6850747-Heterocapsa_arctica.AAC.1
MKYEAVALNFELVVFTGVQRMLSETEGGSSWSFDLDGAVDVETRMFDTTDAAQLTKLQLARLLIISGKEESSEWKRLSQMRKADLACSLMP